MIFFRKTKIQVLDKPNKVFRVRKLKLWFCSMSFNSKAIFSKKKRNEEMEQLKKIKAYLWQPIGFLHLDQAIMMSSICCFDMKLWYYTHPG